jgi:hypothetical protein
MTKEEMWDWIAEYCNKFEYIPPTMETRGHFRVEDSEGQVTVECNLSDAVEAAAAKLKEANS